MEKARQNANLLNSNLELCGMEQAKQNAKLVVIRDGKPIAASLISAKANGEFLIVIVGLLLGYSRPGQQSVDNRDPSPRLFYDSFREISIPNPSCIFN